jgi:hypothetical protein
MARSTFRQHDVTRALRAAAAAGMKPQRAELDPVSGKIVIVLSDGTEALAPVSAEVSALDVWRASRGAR